MIPRFIDSIEKEKIALNSAEANLTGQISDVWGTLYSRNGLTRFMKSEGFFMSRSLGQNFLINKKVLNSFLEKSDFPTEGTVIEIGPGIGNLTWLLLERGLKVVAVEKDNMFAERMPNWVKQWGFDESQLAILHQDALETDFKELAETHDAKHVIGNLPYNVSVPILFHLAYSGARFDSICVMVQKEVGDRILSVQGCKSYGRLSVVLKYLFDIKKVMIINPGAFYPQPKVDSVFLKFVPRADADVGFAKDFLERVAQIGFMHRRKKIRKNLKGCIVQKRVFQDEMMEKLETAFDLDSRAEDWPLKDWIRFATFIRDCEPDQ